MVEHDGRRAFLAEIPQRLAAIEENWGELRAGSWQEKLLEQLYTRIRDLADAANQFDLFQLGESIFSAEVYLSSFVDDVSQPNPRQLEELDGLIRALRAAADSLADEEAKRPASRQSVVYTLSDGGELVGKVAEALQQRDTRTENFDDAKALIDAVDREQPDAVVVDTAQLPQVGRVSTELVRLQAHQALRIPLVFVSGSKNLQLRIDAMRAGGDAYFVAPLDAPRVADRIIRLAHPDESEPRKVMVVEDDPTQADFAGSILRKAGMEVRVVTEPLSVMQELEAFKPDLILMDIYMPDVNGIELTTIIREHNAFATTPIVFLSGEQDTDKQLDALSVGGDDFIAKPIRPKHLLAIVEHRIQRARSVMQAVGARRERDRVTGLFNRRHFFERIARAVESPESHQRPAAIVHIQPDRLGELRQQQGIGAVDTMIADLGERVRSLVSAADVASRFDENTIALFARRENAAEIADLAERLRQAVAERPFAMGGQAVKVTASVGYCLLEAGQDDAAGLAARAERASTLAASEGGNRVVAYAPPRTGAAPAGGAPPIVDHIREAVHDDRLVVQYQPLLDLRARGSENYELLLCVPHPSGDLYTEAEYREAAAEANLLDALDRWLVERAVEQIKRRRDASRHPHLFIRQLGNEALSGEFPAWLAGRLRSLQTVGTGLVLDYRLADVSQHLKAAQQTFRALHDMDIQIALSRFPEKPAAFKVLRFLQADYIEVTPRLLKADPETIRFVVGEAHKADAQVIVGNIDDAKSVDLHWSAGADYIQGNFIQRPLENMDYDFFQVVV
ncbi:MAG: EAL domain-containing protein [Gammaproteobacteria bacterium]|jgi:diguanylate cyclase (GGDEF)-like protein